MAAEPRAIPQLRHRIALLLRAYPVTVVTCAGLVFAAWLTDTAFGRSIGRSALDRLGFAPNDLLDIVRLAGSALVTHGGLEFWVALTLTALFLGLAEKLAGSERALASFWGVHVTTLVLQTLILAPLHWQDTALATAVFFVRDVGPSAGYVGALGIALAYWPWRWRGRISGIALVVVGASLAFALAQDPPLPDQVSAYLAHAIALPLGIAAGTWMRSAQESRRRSSERR